MSTISPEERHEIASRLAEIKAETDAIRSNGSPSDERTIAELDRETTELLRQLSEGNER